MTATRALIVNGDDFGLTPGVNEGILHAHVEGILTSASLFANTPATDEAIAIARRVPTLGVGVHLALVDGVPLVDASRVPTLAPGGAFRHSWGAFAADALAGRIRLDEVERELTAQVERLHDAGLHLTHLDGHKHVHAYPPVFAIVARLARRFGIGRVRVPAERRPFAEVVRWSATRGARRQAIENVALQPWAMRDRGILRRDGLPPPAHFIGRALTGLLTPARLRDLIDRIPPGTSELMTHPGYPDAALDRVRTRLRAERRVEVEALTDPAVLDAIDRAGIQLVAQDGRVRPGREAFTRAS